MVDFRIRLAIPQSMIGTPFRVGNLEQTLPLTLTGWKESPFYFIETPDRLKS